MKPLFAFPLAVLLLTSAAPAQAGTQWALRLGLGESLSAGGHGTAAEAQMFAEVKHDFALGMETGLAYTRLEPQPRYAVAAGTLGGAISSVTDGVTRNRDFFLGPMVRWGSTLYAVASYGIADVIGNTRGSTQYLQGGSVGLGLGGSARFEPSAELRYRWISDGSPFGQRATTDGGSMTFTLGFHLR